MEVAARVNSKGHLTVPKAVREALGIGEGDTVVFRVEGDRAVMTRTPNFISLAGTIEVSPVRRGAAWDDVIREVRSARADRRQ